MKRLTLAKAALLLSAIPAAFAEECSDADRQLLTAFDDAREQARSDGPPAARLAGLTAFIEAAAAASDPLLLRLSCRQVLAEIDDPAAAPWRERLAPCPAEIVAGETPLDGPLEVAPWPELPEGATGPMPIVRLSPGWPRRALRSGLEGRVSFTFTIDPEGRVRDIRVVDSTARMFVRQARQALERFRYIPMQLDGVATALEDVPFVIEFEHDSRALRERRSACEPDSDS